MKIKLFFFIPSLEYGGAGNAIINFLNYLDRNKFDLNLIFQGDNKYRSHIPSYVKVFKLKKNKTFINFFEIKKIVKRNIYKSGKNIFISNIHFSNVLSIIFLKNIINLKIVAFERTSLKELDLPNPFFNLKNIIIKLLIILLYKYTDQIFTNAKNISKDLSKLNINSKVVYSGLINKILPKKKHKKKLFYKLIAVGRLSEQKDYFTLIKAIKILKNKNFKLFIYGEGKLKNRINYFIKENNLNHRITIMGHVKNKEKIYRDADLIILSSIFEGIPNCIVEAINYSVPVIASRNHGGNKEILKNGKFGDLFRMRDEVQLANKINSFFQNPKKLQKKVKLGSNSLNKFLIKNTSKNLENNLFKLY